MRIRYYVTDLYLATTAMKRRVEDPRVGREGMRDGRYHGDSSGRSHAADVGEEDVADDDDFGEEKSVTWVGC